MRNFIVATIKLIFYFIFYSYKKIFTTPSFLWRQNPRIQFAEVTLFIQLSAKVTNTDEAIVALLFKFLNKKELKLL